MSPSGAAQSEVVAMAADNREVIKGNRMAIFDVMWFVELLWESSACRITIRVGEAAVR
jgi:hypothetical protein